MIRRRSLLTRIAATAVGAFVGSSPIRPARAVDDEGDRQIVITVVEPESYIDPLASKSAKPVGIAIQFYFDVSGSITDDPNEYQAQLDAIASAIENPGFREAIFGVGGPGSAAICIGDFAATSKLQIGWMDFRENNPEKFQQLAQKIRALKRRSHGGTEHYTALVNADKCFDRLPWECPRKFVNILTDGTIPPGLIPDTQNWRALLAEKHEAAVSTFVTRSSGINDRNAYAVTKTNLTTPANTFMRKDGLSFVPGGETVEVAVELDTQGGNIGRYEERFFQAVRRQIQVRWASLVRPAPPWQASLAEP